jgi:hypothetical protein
MDHNWRIMSQEEEYVYTHRWVGLYLCWSFDFSHGHWGVEMALWAQVAPVLVEVYLNLCDGSMPIDSLLWHFATEGSCEFDFHSPMWGVFQWQPLAYYLQEMQQGQLSVLAIWCNDSCLVTLCLLLWHVNVFIGQFSPYSRTDIFSTV